MRDTPSAPAPEETTVNLNISVLSLNLGEVKDKESWYVDNGATSHVTNSFDLFQNHPFNSTVTGANGQCIDAAGMDDIFAEANVNNRQEPILLKNLWYVPSIK